MPIVRERIEGRTGSLDSSDFTFFPYQLLSGSGGSSGGSGGPTVPGSTTIRTLTPEELEAILAGGGGRLETNPEPEDPEEPGEPGGGSCISLGAGFLFAPSGRYQRKFHVVTSPCEPLLNARTARDAVGIPKLGDPFPVDQFALAVSKNAESEPDDPGVFYVTVEYSREGNPLLVPWDIDWDFNTFTVAATTDIDNNPVVNSVGDPFDPPVEIEQRRFVLSLTRNVAAWSLTRAIEYSEAVNNAPVRIGDNVFEAKRLKVVAWKATSFQYLGKRFWRETLVVEHNPKTWDVKVQNLGFRDANGNQASSRGFIANFGAPLDKATGQFLNPGEEIQYQEFRIYPELDFCPLFLNYGN